MNGDGVNERHAGECGSGRGPVGKQDRFIVADSSSVSTSANNKDSNVWLSQTAMKNKGIYNMDPILLKGSRNKKMVCSVRPIDDDECGKGQILMNSVIRRNLGVNIQDEISYKFPIKVELGKKIVVSPIHEDIAQKSPDFLLREYIAPFFKDNNFVVHEGNIFTAPSIHLGQSADFEVIRTTVTPPTPFCEVGPGVIYIIEFGAHQKRSCKMDADNDNRDLKDVKLFALPKVEVLKNEIVEISTVKPEDVKESSGTSSENASNEAKSRSKSDPSPVLAILPPPPPVLALLPRLPPPPPTSAASQLVMNETESLDRNDQNYNVTVPELDNSQPNEESPQAQQLENVKHVCDALDKRAKTRTRPKQKPVSARPTPSAAGRPLRQDPEPVQNWLSQTIFKRSPYFPQMHDDLVYLRQAHELFVKKIKQETTTLWLSMKKEMMKHLPYVQDPTLSAAEAVKVIVIEFDISNNYRFVRLQLALTDWNTGVESGKVFDVAYKDIDGVSDFLVLRQIYDRSLNHRWKASDKFRFMDSSMWVVGTVLKKHVHQAKFPDSHFQSFCVQWDGTEDRVDLSPWDMEITPPDFEAQIPSNPYDGVPASDMDINLSKNGAYKTALEDWPPGRGQEGECARISKDFAQFISSPLGTTFHKEYKKYAGKVAYPVDLPLMRSRLDQLFYRRPAAMLTDIESISISVTKIHDPEAAPTKNAHSLCKLLKKILATPDFLDISDCESVLTPISSATSLSVEDDQGSKADAIRPPDTSGRPSGSATQHKNKNLRASVASVATDPKKKNSQKRAQKTGDGVGEKNTEMGGCVNKKRRTGLPFSDSDSIDMSDDDDDYTGNDTPRE